MSMEPSKHIPVLHPSRVSMRMRIKGKAMAAWGMCRRLFLLARSGTDSMSAKPADAIDWANRARQLGVYAVIDGRHSPQEYDYVTAKQKEILLPILRKHCPSPMLGDALDYGCGVGRFTPDLAAFVSGSILGFDPTRELIALAPKGQPRVDFTDDGQQALSGERRYALIWICLVLGGMSDEQIQALAPRLMDALLPDGMFFVMEATADEPSGGHWRVRTTQQIHQLLSPLQLKNIDQYKDVDQRISVFLGKRSG
jgi:SAM-dependent methyltransferase